jgi:hypothetical protein
MKTNRQTEAETELAKVREEIRTFMANKGKHAATWDELGEGFALKMFLDKAKAELAAANREAEFKAKNPPLPVGGVKRGAATLADILGTSFARNA